MNYEELMLARDAKTLNLGKLPIGNVYKQLIDRKYTNIVKIKPSLVNNCVFGGDVDYECKVNQTIKDRHQLHFTPISKDDNIIALKVEMGSFQTVESLLSNNPAVVASHHFIPDTISDLLDFTDVLHQKKIYHVCYAPSTVFARNGSNGLLFLSHGSFYSNIKDRNQMFGEFSAYIAPEVLEGGEIDERTDIYSIGKFIECLFAVSSMPYQYKNVVARATQVDPQKRYQSVADMRRDISIKNKLYKSLFTFAGAAIVALIGIGIFWDLTPTTTPVEFVKPAPRQATDDLLDDGFDPRTELGVISADSSIQLTPAQQKKQAEYQKKNEEIFRKQYAAAAARIINKVYNKQNMSNNEKRFIAGSQATLDQLSKLQTDLGGKANLTDAKSQKIAAEVINDITEQKMDQIMK